MENGLFRKKSMERISSPEELHDYMRVTSPRLWMILGASVLLAYLMVFLLGQIVLKNLVSRPRPCQIDQAFAMLVARPSSSSFPSTHSAWAFGAATAIFLRHRWAGIAAFVVAALIAFSRMYMFLHFPTDVLFGTALGIALGVLANLITGRTWERFEKPKA